MLRQDGTGELYSKAEELYGVVSKEEIVSWYKHPMTQSLMYSLYGDMAGHFESWANGDFTGETNDVTVQRNSRALGAVASIESLLAWIEDAKTGELYD